MDFKIVFMKELSKWIINRLVFFSISRKFMNTNVFECKVCIFQIGGLVYTKKTYSNIFGARAVVEKKKEFENLKKGKRE